MGVRFPSAQVNAAANVLPANATETIICQLPPLIISQDFSQIYINWFLNILAGTGTTALVLRLRQGTTVAGAVLGSGAWTHTLAAGNSAAISGSWPDRPGAVAGFQYVLTCSQTGATAAGTINDVAMFSFAL